MSGLVQALAVARKEEAALSAKLQNATNVLQVSEAAFNVSGADSDLDRVQRDRLRVERATKLHADAVAAVVAAEDAVDAAEVAAARVQHQTDLATLPRFGESLQPLHTRLIELDKAAFALLCDYDMAVEAGQVAWDAAELVADRVRSTLANIPRPNLPDALLAAETAATTAREAEDRETCADMFDAPIGWKDWRMNGATAVERAAMAAKAAETEKRTTLAEGARAAVVAINSGASRG